MLKRALYSIGRKREEGRCVQTEQQSQLSGMVCMPTVWKQVEFYYIRCQTSHNDALSQLRYKRQV